MRTRPLSMRYIALPVSPCRKRRVFRGTILSESRLRNSVAAASSSEAKSGTERSAASLTSLTGCDITSSNKQLLNYSSILHEHDAIGETIRQLLIVRDHQHR